jgi:hypothetical protein
MVLDMMLRRSHAPTSTYGNIVIVMVKEILYYILFHVGGHWEACEEGCLGDIRKSPQFFCFFKQ